MVASLSRSRGNIYEVDSTETRDSFFFFNDTATTEIYTLSLHDALPISTGSGKTTTLYSALNELNNPDYNIVTVEDPVEFQIPGINQVPVNKEIGLTFANALRSILRQDPDICMI